jgi:hypothetical protein
MEGGEWVRRIVIPLILSCLLVIFLASCASQECAKRLPDPRTDDKTNIINRYNKALADSKPILMVFNVRSAS